MLDKSGRRHSVIELELRRVSGSRDFQKLLATGIRRLLFVVRTAMTKRTARTPISQ